MYFLYKPTKKDVCEQSWYKPLSQIVGFFGITRDHIEHIGLYKLLS